jgi:hypothetical protein
MSSKLSNHYYILAEARVMFVQHILIYIIPYTLKFNENSLYIYMYILLETTFEKMLQIMYM